MKPLLFGAPSDKSEVRPTPRTSWKRCWPRSPSARTKSTSSGSPLPGGDEADPLGYLRLGRKLVLGDIDNPMAAVSSLPHMPGHEVGRGGCLGSGTHGARRQAPTPLYPGR